MERQIKLIWDFRGPQAFSIAKHHEIHLKDFIKAEKITDRDLTGFEGLSDLHAIAFWVVPESEIKKYRDVLKPNRATVYEK
ncbi:hypothetical protein JM83_2485 [Gillisia sp. Hel_I_86]|uniref:hypothetical protein n=1 Tax=Gillisia sp. Hel_I_86 TaxID=1249981 RepID=UPI00119A60F7|nr:hypothetical protein [Gillisia sp. Hel_I_86]TVZ27448.1 hypothetical protein JM83_2485 [Gillisia sp. Hel_I_86]